MFLRVHTWLALNGISVINNTRHFVPRFCPDFWNRRHFGDRRGSGFCSESAPILPRFLPRFCPDKSAPILPRFFVSPNLQMWISVFSTSRVDFQQQSPAIDSQKLNGLVCFQWEEEMNCLLFRHYRHGGTQQQQPLNITNYCRLFLSKLRFELTFLSFSRPSEGKNRQTRFSSATFLNKHRKHADRLSIPFNVYNLENLEFTLSIARFESSSPRNIEITLSISRFPTIFVSPCQ